MMNPFNHTENVLSLLFAYRVIRTRVSMAASAGPAYFSTTQDVVAGVSYQETFNPTTFAQTVTIVNTQTQNESM